MVSNAAGVFDRRPTPFQIADLPSAIVEIAIGWGHACARADNGSVWCWGRNDHGTLGDGSAVFFATLPVEVRGLGQNVVQLASNASHTCARKDDGTLWCWGSNYEGQLGDGTTTDRAMPVQVQLPTRVRQVAVSSEDRTCAVLDDGTAWCWGNNDGCELGDCNGFRSSVPVQISGLSSVASISAGDTHTCALTSDGAIWCWGDNSDGELGNGTRDVAVGTKPVRAAVPGTVFVEVCAGPGATCARAQDGGVWCWGAQNGGLLGDGQLGFAVSAVRLVGCQGQRI
jgi:alpha-tubulin suppressor-like RCC1 family protein